MTAPAAPAPLVLEAVTARLAPGRRGPLLACAGALRLPAGVAIEELAVVAVAVDAAGGVVAVDEARLEPARAVGDRLPFAAELRLPPGGAVARVELWAAARIEEHALVCTVPGAALADPGPGRLARWQGGGLCVVREPVQTDGEVRLIVQGRCPFRPGQRYERSGEVQLTVRGADGGVAFHDTTSFPTRGGALGAVPFSERLRPHADALAGAAAFELALLVTRHQASAPVVVEGADLGGP